MKNFKLLNDTFIHLTNGNKGYSTHGKESKYIKWIHEGEGKQQLTFNNLTPMMKHSMLIGLSLQDCRIM